MFSQLQQEALHFTRRVCALLFNLLRGARSTRFSLQRCLPFYCTTTATVSLYNAVYFFTALSQPLFVSLPHPRLPFYLRLCLRLYLSLYFSLYTSVSFSSSERSTSRQAGSRLTVCGHQVTIMQHQHERVCAMGRTTRVGFDALAVSGCDWLLLAVIGCCLL